MRTKLAFFGVAGMLVMGTMAVSATAPANASVTGCTTKKIPGAPFPGGQSLCTDRTHQVLLTCKASQFSDDEDSWLGPVAARNKPSNRYCTARYPVFVSAMVWFP